MSDYRLLYLESVPPEVEALVRGRIPAGFRFEVRRAGQPVGDAIADADFVLLGTTPMTADVIAAAKRLRLIQHQGVGYDNTDLAAAARRGIPVATCPAGTITSVAEHVIMLVLAVSRRLLVADAAVRRGEWLHWELRTTSHDLRGKTVGILGFGRIGRQVAHLVHAFDARVIYHDVMPADAETERRLGATFVPFDELLATADIVTVHVPLTPDTLHLIGAAQIGLMKPSAMLINTARGGLVDDAALASALNEGRLGGAGIDVYDGEPPRVEAPLLTAPNVVLTSHIAAGTRDALETKIDFCVGNMQRVADGLEPLNQVRPMTETAGGDHRMSSATTSPIRTHTAWARPPAEVVAAFHDAPSGNVSDALASPIPSAMDPLIKPLLPESLVAGPALTVRTRGGDNLAIWMALKSAQAGDVLVIATGEHEGAGTFGELFVIAARNRGVAGIVTDGMCRDAAGIRQTGVPTFVRGLHPRGSEKRGPGEIGSAIRCGGLEVGPGDVVVADEDGIVVVPIDRASEVAARLVDVAAKERSVMAELEAGGVVLSWVDKHAEAVGHEIVE